MYYLSIVITLLLCRFSSGVWSNSADLATRERLLQTVPSVQPKTGLNATCSNKLCLMYESALSCKVFGFNLKKICAQYLLGTALQCKIFPQDLFNAPYPCATELQQIASLIQGGAPNLQSGLIGTYVKGNFTANCMRNCYQTYITRAIDFYGQCSAPLQHAPLNETYKVTVALSNFNQLRNQSCVHNDANQNCLSLATALSTENTTTDIFDTTCEYDGQSSSDVLTKLCRTVSQWGCCWGTQTALAQQNQVNATSPRVIAPCLQRYLAINCPAVDVGNLCSRGARSPVITIKGQVTILTSTTRPAPLPNIYTTMGTLTLQGELMAALVYTLQQQKHSTYGLNYKIPLQLEIYNYTYFNNQGPTSTYSGLPPAEYAADYDSAIGASFFFVLVLSGINQTDAAIIQQAINSPFFSLIFQLSGNFGTCRAESELAPVALMADPYPTYSSGAVGGRGAVSTWVVMSCALSALLTMLCMGVLTIA